MFKKKDKMPDYSKVGIDSWEEEKGWGKAAKEESKQAPIPQKAPTVGYNAFLIKDKQDNPIVYIEVVAGLKVEKEKGK